MHEKQRCDWCRGDALMEAYHDLEWGVPLHDDLKHFEFMLLDAFQAGLSWKTILHRREHFRKAFDNFNPEKIARYTDKRIEKLLQNEGIIRNRQKIKATVTNAQNFLRVQQEFGSFDAYIWKFVNGKPKVNKWKSLREIPARTDVSDAMSRDLMARGFKFAGSTICYAYMQAAGLVNDHLVHCHRYRLKLS
jgi:DNA-3-methyladenine glycosylase I